MCRHLAPVGLVTILWLLFRALTTSALAIEPQGTITTASNQTQGGLTINFTLSEALDVSSTPSRNFISYHVPNSPTTLMLHSFGSTIPTNELLKTIGISVKIVLDNINHLGGKTPIDSGFFVHQHMFRNHDEVNITVGDFREIGLPMNYFILCDVLRGIGEFVLMQSGTAREVQFEVEVKEIGYLGSGHVDHRKNATPTSTVA